MDWRWTDSLGVALMGADTAARAVGWARAAERAGLGSVWIIEDYFQPGAFSLAGAAAAATEQVAIGLGVVNPYTRHPALIAMETAALAGLSAGRLVLGLGSRNRRWIEEQMGLDFHAPLAGLGESVGIIRSLLRGERVSFRGARFHLEGVELEHAPKEEVPILLGVKGPRALRLAGEVADGVHCSVLATPAHVRRVREATAGRSGHFVVISYVPMLVGEDGRRTRERLKPVLARYLGLLHGQSILADAGFGAERTQPFRDALVRGDDSAALVTDEMVEAFAVAGTPEECRTQLRRFADAGLDTAVAVVPRDADLAAQIGRIGAELSPAWKELRWR
jgi:5,10-methylenetetrahydromethanopterin reductase